MAAVGPTIEFLGMSLHASSISTRRANCWREGTWTGATSVIRLDQRVSSSSSPARLDEEEEAIVVRCWLFGGMNANAWGYIPWPASVMSISITSCYRVDDLVSCHYSLVGMMVHILIHMRVPDPEPVVH